MSKGNHKPIRTCLGCREKDEKAQMVRIAASGDAIVLDPELSIAGRGGYLHIRSQCLEGFVKAKVREFRSLRRTIHRETRLKIVEEIRTRLDREAVLE